MSLDFRRNAYPAYEEVEENGKPVPCALGQPWVNDDTLRTLERMEIPRTDPWGRPLPGEALARVRDRDRGPS